MDAKEQQQQRIDAIQLIEHWRRELDSTLFGRVLAVLAHIRSDPLRYKCNHIDRMLEIFGLLGPGSLPSLRFENYLQRHSPTIYDALFSIDEFLPSAFELDGLIANDE